MLIHERAMSSKLAQPLYFSFHKKEPSINRAEIIGVWQRVTKLPRMWRSMWQDLKQRANVAVSVWSIAKTEHFRAILELKVYLTP